jgi:hypothetical protein
MFNALVAPMVFNGLAELGIAIFAAGFLRPKLKDSGWTDDIVAGMLEPAPEPATHAVGGGKAAKTMHAVAKAGATPQMVMALDFILPACVLLLGVAFAFVFTGMIESIVSAGAKMDRDSATIFRTCLTFGIPLIVACFYFARPVRFGLAVGAVILVHLFYEYSHDSSQFRARSFFGIISVNRSYERIKVGPDQFIDMPFHQLLHGTTNHGMNFLIPKKDDEIGDPQRDLRRLATTYYHRLGPAGRVMEGYNWFPNSPDNVYSADARMPAAIVGSVMADVTSSIPMAGLVNLWSEPPYATVGLGTGTMASYGRPYQHVHYYEIDNKIRRLSLPKGRTYTYDQADTLGAGTKWFNYLDGAIRRGSQVQVLMGDARLRMALPYNNYYQSENDDVPGGGPLNFYHMMVVDAFSSDAIPAHLITKEAIKMYFDRLTEEGILCVHTSNRYVSLPKVVAAVALELNNELTRRGNELRKKHPEMDDKQLAEMYKHERVFGYEYTCKRAHDVAPFTEADGKTPKIGHFTSEWVMVARKPDYLVRLKEPEGYRQALEAMAGKRNVQREEYWRTMTGQRRFLWTDNYYTLWTVLRKRGDPDD